MSKRPIPVAWTTCPHCGAEYDEGNAMAHFHHINGQCPNPTQPEGSHA